MKQGNKIDKAGDKTRRRPETHAHHSGPRARTETTPHTEAAQHRIMAIEIGAVSSGSEVNYKAKDFITAIRDQIVSSGFRRSMLSLSASPLFMRPPKSILAVSVFGCQSDRGNSSRALLFLKIIQPVSVYNGVYYKL